MSCIQKLHGANINCLKIIISTEKKLLSDSAALDVCRIINIMILVTQPSTTKKLIVIRVYFVNGFERVRIKDK